MAAIVTVRDEDLDDVLASVDRLTFRLSCRQIMIEPAEPARWSRARLYALVRVRDVETVMWLPCVHRCLFGAEARRTPCIRRLLCTSHVYTAVDSERRRAFGVALAIIQRVTILAERTSVLT